MNQYDAQKERNQRRKKKLMQRLVIISMAFMMVFGVMLTYHFKQRTLQTEMQGEYDNLAAQLEDLEQQEKFLLEEIGLLNDETYILDIARTNYFLSKEGELIFQIENGEEERTY
jgi:cell division protein DivIC